MQIKSLLHSWRDTLDLDDGYLFESRKSDAIAKYPKITTDIHTMVDRDPTNNNKYLPYFAKVYGSIYEKMWKTVYDDRLAIERRLAGPFRALVDIREDAKKYTDSEMRHKASSFMYDIIFFHNHQNLFEHRDIFKYFTIESLRTACSSAEHKLEQREMEKQLAKTAKQGASAVYYEHNMIVRRITSHAASALYGLGAQWCISQRDNPSYWNDYEKQGSAFLFLELKNNPPRQNKQKFAFQYTTSGLEDIYNEEDHSAAVDELKPALHEHLIRDSKDKKSLELILNVIGFFDEAHASDLEELAENHGPAVAEAYERILLTTYGYDDISDMDMHLDEIITDITDHMEHNIDSDPPGPSWDEVISAAETEFNANIEHLYHYFELQVDGDIDFLSWSFSYTINADDLDELPWLNEDAEHDDEIEEAVTEFNWTYHPDEIEVYNGEVELRWLELQVDGDIEDQLNDLYYYAKEIDSDIGMLFDNIVEHLNDANLLRNANSVTIEEKILALEKMLNNFELTFESNIIFARTELVYDFELFKRELAKKIDITSLADWGETAPPSVWLTASNTDKMIQEFLTDYYKKLFNALAKADSKQTDLFGKDSPQSDLFGIIDKQKFKIYTPPRLVTAPAADRKKIKVIINFAVGEYSKDDNEEPIFTLQNSLHLLKFINNNTNDVLVKPVFTGMIAASVETNKHLKETKTINFHDVWKNFLK